MPDEYLLVVEGKPEGPYTIEQLKQLNIKPADFVKTETMPEYKEAHEVAELCGLFGFKQQSVVPQYFGSFDQRATASVIDWFWVSLFCVPPILLIVIFIPDQSIRLILAFSLLVIIPVVNTVNHIVMECSAKQATFGKRILKLKVCDMEGRRIGLSNSIGRNLAKLFSLAPFFIGYVICFFTKQQQCLHDTMAGTLVMKDRLF